MDAKELNETTTKLYARLRELSQEKLSKPITVKRKTGDEKSRGFGISNYRDLLWLPVGTLLYADSDYFMKKSTEIWVSTFRDRPLDAKELFAVFVSLAADDFPIYFVFIPDTFEGA
jgi:hypothetical protein